jgi:hypothetical protein
MAVIASCSTVVQAGANIQHRQVSGSRLILAIRRAALAMVLLALAGCAGSRTSTSAPHQTGSNRTWSPLPWRHFYTIPPEQMQAARPSSGGRPAEEDSDGYWGSPVAGFQLSIRLPKAVFTNGEPVIACVTLRNITDQVLGFSENVGGASYPDERDTAFILMRGDERVLGVDDDKPGMTFLERLSLTRAGKSFFCLLPPGTQRQFFRDLAKVFDLRQSGTYIAQARRDGLGVFNFDRSTNILSGKVTFTVADAAKHD